MNANIRIHLLAELFFHTMAAFTPKQAMPRDDRLFSIIGANITLAIAEHETSLLPEFPEDSIIHDAACGGGAVTKSIMATSPPQSISIEASDIGPGMIEMYNALANKNSWPYKAVLKDCQQLDFSDSTFTHVFLSLGLPIMSDPVAAAKEIYRTLKLGGTAITAYWLSIPHGESAGETRQALWGPQTTNANQPHPRHKDPGFIRELLIQGGFRFEDVKLYEKKVVHIVKDINEFGGAVWSATGMPTGGWTQEDEDRWDEAVSVYKRILREKEGYSIDQEGNIVLESVAQIAIVEKRI